MAIPASLDKLIYLRLDKQIKSGTKQDSSFYVDTRNNVKQEELSAWVCLNVEVRVKHPWLNHDGKIFKNTSTSYLKNNLIKINEHNKHNTGLSLFSYITPKLKGIESTTFY